MASIKPASTLLTNSMQADYDENVVSQQDIIKAVVDAGYGASPADTEMPPLLEELRKERF